MGSAIARGLLAAGTPAADLTIANPSPEKLAPFREAGCHTTQNNLEAAEKADIIIVAVKPYVLPKVAEEIRTVEGGERKCLSVVAAGVSGEDLKKMFSNGDACPAITLAMPNTAVSCRQSMTFLVPVVGDSRNPDIPLYSELGDVKVIDEKLLPAATALASCGIAYALRYIRAATEGGVQLGFRAADAQAIVAQTVKGAAALLAGGAHAEAEIDKVTTPGGLTIRGLNAMEKSGFTSAVIAGLTSNN